MDSFIFYDHKLMRIGIGCKKKSRTTLYSVLFYNIFLEDYLGKPRAFHIQGVQNGQGLAWCNHIMDLGEVFADTPACRFQLDWH